ncbi:MAG: DUF2231 domain-containing protein [Paenibacillaceae bacterium]
MDRSKLSAHPLHPLITHFPMALWTTSLLWDLLGLWREDPLWWSFSFWSIAVGLIIAFFAMVTGFIDYMKLPQGGPEEGVAMWHMVMVMTAAALYAGSLFFRFGTTTPSGIHLIMALVLSFLGFVSLLVGGWYGGELVYRYGVGRTKE